METYSKQSDHYSRTDASKPESTPKSTLSPFIVSTSHLKQRSRGDGLAYSNPVSPLVKTPRRKSKLSLNINSPLTTSSQSDGGPRKTSIREAGMATLSKFCPPRLSNPNILPEPKTNPQEAFLSPRTRKIISSKVVLVKAPSTKNMGVPIEQKTLRKGPVPEFARNSDSSEKGGGSETLPSHRPKKSSFSREGNLQGMIFDSVEFPSEDFEAHLGDSIVKQTNNGITRCSTMESSCHLGKTKLCIEPSSPENKTRKSIATTITDKEYESHTTFSSPSSKVFSRHLKLQQTQSNSSSRRGSYEAKGKSSITLHRFAEAVEKAKIFNDGVILQYQFDKQNEEEEHDFFELCEMLQSKVKE